MGLLNITNVVGVRVSVKSLTINKANLQPEDIESGASYSWACNGNTATNFDRMILKIQCNNTMYQVDLNRGHFFGDNRGAYPGSDYDINLVLMGFSGGEIKVMMVYRSASGGTFNYSSDSKNMNSM